MKLKSWIIGQMGNTTPCARPLNSQICKRERDRFPRGVVEGGGEEEAVEASAGVGEGEGVEDFQTGHLEAQTGEGLMGEGDLKDLPTGVGTFHKTKGFDFDIAIHGFILFICMLCNKLKSIQSS